MDVSGSAAACTAEAGEELGFFLIEIVGPNLEFLTLASHVENLASVWSHHSPFEIGGVNREAFDAVLNTFWIEIFLFLEELFPVFVFDFVALGLGESEESMGAVG